MKFITAEEAQSRAVRNSPEFKEYIRKRREEAGTRKLILDARFATRCFWCHAPLCPTEEANDPEQPTCTDCMAQRAT